MRNLSSLIVFLAISLNLFAQSPHGDELQISCEDCHNPKGWKLEKGAYTFNHAVTKFSLDGQHQDVDCKMCHKVLIFSKAESECVSCHTDMHYQTVGPDCARCHTPQSWIVTNITQLHQESRFPLLGPHATADCYSCHPSASLLRFEPLGVDCYDCHRADYEAATNPNHLQSDYSKECTDCHSMTAFTWSGANFIHPASFPLSEGHIINECSKCHVNNNYNISAECVSCHQPDYNTAANPNHISADFSTNCTDCHTTKPDWKPADFRAHDGQFFPIYSGEHNGEWNTCADCHTNPANYAENSCVGCHEHNQADMNDEHGEVQGYIYNSQACLECHPTGSGEGSFNHNTSNFPLTGAHTSTDCIDCHSAGYGGTTTVCSDCHIADFNQSINPNHTENNLGTDCETCHTTEPDWQPALFPTHNETYPLTGAHGRIATDCGACHEGNYVNSPNTCVGCHQEDYNQTTNPPHASAQFSTDCETCHDNVAWVPSTFNHDGQYFPIYSGEHLGEWDACTDCHTNPANYTAFTCTNSCHPQNETDPEHQGIGGYSYNSEACFICHPTGEGSGGFNHNTTGFPLTGAHLTVVCLDCHESGYAGTPTECVACHNADFTQATNPNHNALGISTDCASCHTTNPDWKPATFAVHNEYYVLQGAHASIANDCFTCHNGNYNSTPNTCFACHTDDYNQTTDPNHASAQFPTACEDCHSQTAWEPSTFNHDGQYFPIYSGEHQGEWDACSDCHTNPSNYAVFTCTTTCHPQNEMNNEHNGVSGYQYNSEACFACHPTGSSGGAFNHNSSSFPLTGAHITVGCAECHSNGYTGTPTECLACHDDDFNQTANPNHNALGIPTDCATCHTTNPDWKPATFGIHNQFYPLTGAHATVASDCFACHAGNYNNTSNQCSGCHINNYNQSTNPNHSALAIPTTCETCHTTNPDWQPATFGIHNQYYVLQGAHASIANDCFTCHNGNYNSTPNTCFACHTDDYNQTTDPNHASAQFPTACEDCHSQTAWEPSTFNHDGQYFPIYSGEHQGEWDACSDCHTNPSNYAIFTCTTTCHPQGEMNNEHSGVSGYQYNSAACFACHPTGNSGGAFNHNSSSFPLTGAHITVECAECHSNGYAGTPTECLACHDDDFNQSTNPNHNALGLPTDCATCHTTNPDWKPAIFTIHNQFYALTGAHASISTDCNICHEGNYNNTPNQCSGCHINNYNQSTNPNHSALAIPTTCETCHTTNPDWQPATFGIHNQYYVLQGAHASIANDCFTCHNGNYNSTPNTCFACHSSDYNQTNDPPHASAQFPTACEDCHTQNAWEPSTFNHDQQYFPIYSGEHQGEWDACSDCHTNPSNYAIFTCTTSCHPQGEMNQEHDDVSGYQYNSVACLNCHPDGNGGKRMLIQD
jgi:mRNA-degrading endonuclease YafQ of YafQ-DinJ toxin-antitoxin module